MFSWETIFLIRPGLQNPTLSLFSACFSSGVLLLLQARPTSRAACVTEGWGMEPHRPTGRAALQLLHAVLAGLARSRAQGAAGRGDGKGRGCSFGPRQLPSRDGARSSGPGKRHRPPRQRSLATARERARPVRRRYLGVHVGQAVPAEAVEQAAALELLHDDGDELRVAGRQRGRIGGAGSRAGGCAARAPSAARSPASRARGGPAGAAALGHGPRPVLGARQRLRPAGHRLRRRGALRSASLTRCITGRGVRPGRDC